MAEWVYITCDNVKQKQSKKWDQNPFWLSCCAEKQLTQIYKYLIAQVKL